MATETKVVPEAMLRRLAVLEEHVRHLHRLASCTCVVCVLSRTMDGVPYGTKYASYNAAHDRLQQLETHVNSLTPGMCGCEVCARVRHGVHGSCWCHPRDAKCEWRREPCLGPGGKCVATEPHELTIIKPNPLALVRCIDHRNLSCTCIVTIHRCQVTTPPCHDTHGQCKCMASALPLPT